MKYKKFAMGLLLLAGSQLAQAEQIGSVDTVFKWLGPDHKIVVEAFDDPDVPLSGNCGSGPWYSALREVSE